MSFPVMTGVEQCDLGVTGFVKSLGRWLVDRDAAAEEIAKQWGLTRQELARIPFDIVKIDRSFIDGIAGFSFGSMVDPMNGGSPVSIS